MRQPRGTGYPQEENIQIHIFLLSKTYSFNPLSSCASKCLTQDILINFTSRLAPFPQSLSSFYPWLLRRNYPPFIPSHSYPFLSSKKLQWTPLKKSLKQTPPKKKKTKTKKAQNPEHNCCFPADKSLQKYIFWDGHHSIKPESWVSIPGICTCYKFSGVTTSWFFFPHYFASETLQVTRKKPEN